MYYIVETEMEPTSHAELLELATPQGREMWEEVSLAYTETQGLPELRRLISETLYNEARQSTEPSPDTQPSARLTSLVCRARLALDTGLCMKWNLFCAR